MKNFSIEKTVQKFFTDAYLTAQVHILYKADERMEKRKQFREAIRYYSDLPKENFENHITEKDPYLESFLYDVLGRLVKNKERVLSKESEGNMVQLEKLLEQGETVLLTGNHNYEGDSPCFIQTAKDLGLTHIPENTYTVTGKKMRDDKTKHMFSLGTNTISIIQKKIFDTVQKEIEKGKISKEEGKKEISNMNIFNRQTLRELLTKLNEKEDMAVFVFPQGGTERHFVGEKPYISPEWNPENSLSILKLLGRKASHHVNVGFLNTYNILPSDRKTKLMLPSDIYISVSKPQEIKEINQQFIQKIHKECYEEILKALIHQHKEKRDTKTLREISHVRKEYSPIFYVK